MDDEAENRIREQLTDDAFAAHARFWSETYESKDLSGVMHQDRLDRADRAVAALALEPGTRALDVGCGAGRMATALAERGFLVDGVDRVTEMLRLAREHADRSSVGTRVRLAVGSADALPYASGRFGLVVALGVLPFVPEVGVALAEIERVLRPGGFVVMSASNRFRLDNLIDPAKTPLLAPLKRLARSAAGVAGRPTEEAVSLEAAQSPLEFDRLVAVANLERVRASTVGFGPFRFFHRRLLRERTAMAVHRRLQRLADRDAPVVRSTGAQYLVVARKPLAQGARVSRSG